MAAAAGSSSSSSHKSEWESEYIDTLNKLIEGVNKFYEDNTEYTPIPVVSSIPKGTIVVKMNYKLVKEDQSPYMCMKHTDNYTYMVGTFPEEYRLLKSEDAYKDEIESADQTLYVITNKAGRFTNKRNKNFINLTEEDKPITIGFADGTTKKYRAFKYKLFDKELENDCLNFTERYITGISEKSDCALQPRDLNYEEHKDDDVYDEELFDDDKDLESCMGFYGNTNRHNVRLAMMAKTHASDKVNRNIVVKKGDAIAHVFMGWSNMIGGINQIPYHVVPVLDVDADTFVTVEADAGNPDLTRPVFDIYSMKSDSGLTFWDRHRDNYKLQEEYKIDSEKDDEPITIVLKLRDDFIKGGKRKRRRRRRRSKIVLKL